MNSKLAHYSPVSEVTTAWLLGIISFLVVCAIITLIALPVLAGFDGSMMRTIHQQGLLQTIAQGMMFAVAIPLGFLFWAVFLIALSMPQFMLLALPAAYFGSKGLLRDAARGWVFYGFSGTVIGLGPWLSVILFTANTAFVAQNFPDVKALSIVFLPALCSGLFSGLILKRQLTRLAAVTGIENDIK